VFNFDPLLRIAGLVVRWQTLGTAVALGAAIALAAIVAGRLPGPSRQNARRRRRSQAVAPNQPSRENLLYILCGAVPGALVGGRIGYVLTHLAFYGAHPSAILDMSQGGFELTLAVAGGTMTAAIVAGLFREPIGPWLHVAAIPLLVAIAGGKFSMALGADGQGTPSQIVWATSYLGPGPWSSLGPEIPSHPAQIYEGMTTLIAVAVLLALLRGRAVPGGGRAYFAAIALWCVGRTAAGFAWRDPAVLGPFSAEQILTFAVLLGALAAPTPTPVPVVSTPRGSIAKS
jgi:phosphatidylglycerol:prolipoprotein diacylglycerol transferase